MNMVHKDEFLDLRAETGNLQTALHEVRLFKENIGQSQVDDHYQVVKNAHFIQEMQHSMENIRRDLEKCVEKQGHKLDLEVFEEELELMRIQMN